MSKRFTIAVLVLASSLSLVGLACSGDSGGVIPPADGGGASSEAGGGSNVPPGDDSGGGTDPIPPDDGSTPPPEGDGSSAFDGSAPPGDGALPPPGDGGPLTDAASDAPAPPFTGIACGAAVCHIGSEVCCNRPSKTGRPSTREDACTTAAECADAGIPLACNKPGDCSNGDVCCSTYEPRAGSILSVACAPTCKRVDGGPSLYEVCSTDESPACHFGGTCQVSTATPSLSQPNRPFLVCR